MRSKVVLAILIVLVFGASYLAKGLLARPEAKLARPSGDYERIVSMAPSITETLFALGLDDRVVGVTQYCDYPPEAQSKPCVGGYLNPNYEAVVSLRPDLVITLDDVQRGEDDW